MVQVVPIREKAILPELKDPVLITAFSSHQQGGATATAALAYALEQWNARLVAEFDATECYNHARLRPWIRRVGDETIVDWPQNLVYLVDRPERSFLILIGVEPSFQWPSFVQGVSEFALRASVSTLINLHSAPAMVSHTYATPVRAIYSEDSLREELGVRQVDNQDGSADIGQLLALELGSYRCRTADLWALEPFYAAAGPHAEASMALLQTLERGFGLSVDYSGLRQVADSQREVIEAALAESGDLRRTVQALEQRRAELAEPGLGNESAGLDSSAVAVSELQVEDVLREAEDILRGA